MNARALADAEYLAREIAALRLAIEHKADRDDIADAVRELTLVAERIAGTAPQDGGLGGPPVAHGLCEPRQRRACASRACAWG